MLVNAGGPPPELAERSPSAPEVQDLVPPTPTSATDEDPVNPTVPFPVEPDCPEVA